VGLTVDIGKSAANGSLKSVMAHFPERGPSTLTAVSPDAATAGEFENSGLAHGSGRDGPNPPTDGGNRRHRAIPAGGVPTESLCG
jgi:hypothetical protein